MRDGWREDRYYGEEDAESVWVLEIGHEGKGRKGGVVTTGRRECVKVSSGEGMGYLQSGIHTIARKRSGQTDRIRRYRYFMFVDAGW